MYHAFVAPFVSGVSPTRRELSRSSIVEKNFLWSGEIPGENPVKGVSASRRRVNCVVGGNSTKVDERDVRREARLAGLRDLSRVPGLPSFASRVPAELAPLARRATPTTLQVNIGLTCNLACRHCHVESSPSRSETMSRAVADRLISLTRQDPYINSVDITGGAPEIHEQFRYLVSAFRSMGLRVMDRCNLTVLSLKGQEDLVDFLADNQVHVVASLPCYSVENVEKQRGDGVFDASIEALRLLNSRGYGREGKGLELDLVYNPLGPTLPPPQSSLENDYRRELSRAFGISFSRLICITNMPIKRFADDLRRTGTLEVYMNLLVNSFNPSTVGAVMCRDQIHVAYDGKIYDCDFNYALGLPARSSKCRSSRGMSVFDINSWADLASSRITTGPQCFGCTAGSGSSCGGSLSTNS